MLTRRRFLEQASAASAYAWSHGIHAIELGSLLGIFQDQTLPGPSSDQWKSYGRISLQALRNSVIIRDGFTIGQKTWGDCEFSFTARAPQDTSQVQIWAGIKCRDRDSRYVFALRGGNNDDIYLARYGADGAARFLGIAPLGFHPEPGDWYQLRAVTRANRLLIFLNQEMTPRINVVDDDAPWDEGGISLGGGWLPAEFRGITVDSLSSSRTSAIDALGDAVWETPKVDKQQLRSHQRAAYRPIELPGIDQVRVEYALNGSWLFAPDQELASTAAPQAETFDDLQWHVMDVPNFWTPTLTWLHAEIGFPNLKGVSASKGICDRFYEEEMRRLDSYTFDWRQTKGGWYRQYMDLPESLSRRRFEVCFDAIAKVADVWVNGTKVGSHVGMFGEVRCDITHAVKPGRNVLSVHVVGQIANHASKNEVLGVAVTVEVTSEMLNSLPHGMYPNDAGGIWQPVSLIVTNEVFIEDIYTIPHLNGMDFDVTLCNTTGAEKNIIVSYAITSTDGKLLHLEKHAASKSIGTSSETLRLSTPHLAPKLWSPNEPNLYQLEITLISSDVVLDKQDLSFGFRTFSVDKGRLLLNGQPFWLRGADHFPHALRPNDSVLANHFMQLAKAGNVVATRSHTAPFTSTWLKAADEAGLTVSYEGTWPWLMLEGDLPSEDLLHAWKSEFLALIHKHRNHPSIILWTVNNEMKFEAFDRKNPTLLRQKWEVLNDMVRSIRTTDPTRPIVCDSSYCRREVGTEYEDLIRPSGFDDGDIDDAHRYPGWYEPSFFRYFNGEFGKSASFPGRPLISQEMATGYPRNDDGHPTRFYLFQHHTPQSLVGSEAYENRDPAIFLQRQAFMTKELAETIRRTNRVECAGILHFAYISWFKDVWNTSSIQPLTTYHALATALQPVLVSAELFGRHFYAGAKPTIRVCIINDAADGADLGEGKLIWQVEGAGKVLARGAVMTSRIHYYSNAWTDIVLSLPTDLSSARMDASLSLTLEIGGVVQSKNAYQIVIGMRSWTMVGQKQSVAIFSPKESLQLEPCQITGRRINAFQDARADEIIVVPNAEVSLSNSKTSNEFKQFVNSGGRALLLQPGQQLPTLFPDQVKHFRTCAGEIVTMHIPESPVFKDLEPLDLAWFELGAGRIPRACRGVYQIEHGRSDAAMLAEVVDIHGYLKTPSDLAKYSGTPLVELRIGKGRIFASEMMLVEAANDPIAGKLLSNLIEALGSTS
jgi:hypothetical protein